jgi:hypothetical protein
MSVGNSISHANRALLKEREKWSIPEATLGPELRFVTLEHNLSALFAQSMTITGAFGEMKKGAAKSCP